MYFKQFYLGCLAHASYLLGSRGEAVIVDPQRDVDEYIAEADAQNFKIKYVIETHLHADFVSGHLELAARTGAQIVFSHLAKVEFSHRAVRDGDTFSVGALNVSIIETPGHSPESISILITDAEDQNAPARLLTGDTLFVGDVGRPDLAAVRGFTAEEMAATLYDSLHQKILTLDDSVEIYPAHGAGSMCGRNISKETSSTIGQQRKFNYALQPMTQEKFVEMMTTNLPEAPTYFRRSALLNRAGAKSLSDLPQPAALSPEDVRAQMENGAIVLDVRRANYFGAGNVPRSINIGLDGQFASWAGSLIQPDKDIIIVAEDEKRVKEAVMRLARIGMERVVGFLRGGIETWRESGLPIASIEQISVKELNELMESGEEVQVLDVRQPAEYEGGHVPRAAHIPLAHLARGEEVSSLDASRPVAVICAGGYRSSAAASLLARRNFNRLYNVTGGTNTWKDAGLPIE
jgi:hydroxyacylglutathione hydrolase